MVCFADVEVKNSVFNLPEKKQLFNLYQSLLDGFCNYQKNLKPISSWDLNDLELQIPAVRKRGRKTETAGEC